MNAPAPSTVPPPPLTKTLLYSAANFGYGTFYALNNATLTLYLSQRCPGISNIILGLMGSSHSVEGAVIQPLVGAASDRLRTPYGRRRPFMLLFVPLASLFMLLTPAAGHLPVGGRLLALVGCIFLFTVFFNIAADPYQALLPDVFPSEQRGRVTGISMFLLVLGQAGLVLLPLPLETKFGLVAIIMLLTTFITCLTIREPTHSDPLAKHSHLRELRTALGGLRTLRQAEKALLAVFFYGVGVGAVTPFLTLFVKKITGCSDHSAELMFLALMGSTAVGVLPFGWLSDRVGPKKVLLLGMVLIAVASLNGLWVGNLTQIAFVMLLAGLGNAAQSASAYPLLTQVVPGEEVGFYTGLQSTALSIAAPLTSVVTGKLIDLGGNYRWIFAVCSISVLIGLAALVSVRMNSAGAEVAERDRQQGRVTQGA
jgi:Na+/melibiose symporter-like transporter